MMPLAQMADACVAIAAVPALSAAAYLGVLTLLSSRRGSARPSVGAGALAVPAPLFFDVVVPAHDEADHIADTVASIRAVDYPRDAFRVVVVADNCTDATAAIARSAGADVLERVDADKRGKGYALEHAFAATIAAGRADAVVVIDADTHVTKNLLGAFARRFEQGETVVQAEYGVRNPNASWRTRLMVIAMALFHALRSNARERLHVSCGLRGNGMGFRLTVLRDVPHDAFSIVEDVEYGIRLGEAGHRVAYVAEAAVLGEMVSGGEDARSQRQRWEAGRRQLASAKGWRLIRRGLGEHNALLFDLGADLLVPPLSRLVTWIAAGLVATAVTATLVTRANGMPIAWMPWALAAMLVIAYVVRGVGLSGVGARGFLDLAWAPVYMVWKLVLPTRRPTTWIRTTREKAK